MKMKKTLSIVLAVIVAVTLLTACGGTKAATKMTMGTGGTAGTYYAFGGVLGQYIKNKAGIDVTVVSTDGSKANIESIAGAMLAQVITPVAISIANSFLVEQLLVPWLFAISETTTYALRASLQITLNTLFIKNTSHINIIIYILYVTPVTCGNKLNSCFSNCPAIVLPRFQASAILQ